MSHGVARRRHPAHDRSDPAHAPPRPSSAIPLLGQVLVDALLALVNDILDFSKIEARRLDLEALPFDLRESVEDTRACSPSAPRKSGSSWRATSPAYAPPEGGGIRGGCARCSCRPARQRHQVHRPGRDRAARWRWKTWREGVVLHLPVSDTGVGIAAHSGEIFDAFVQADTSTTRKYGGTGLGLTIASRLVELMDGRIWLEHTEAPGQHVPLRALRSAAGDRSGRAGGVAGALAGLQVLVVDDHKTNARILEEMLQSWGMRPVLVHGGRAALAALAKKGPRDARYLVALVITDFDHRAWTGSP